MSHRIEYVGTTSESCSAATLRNRFESAPIGVRVSGGHVCDHRGAQRSRCWQPEQSRPAAGPHENESRREVDIAARYASRRATSQGRLIPEQEPGLGWTARGGPASKSAPWLRVVDDISSLTSVPKGSDRPGESRLTMSDAHAPFAPLVGRQLKMRRRLPVSGEASRERPDTVK